MTQHSGTLFGRSSSTMPAGAAVVDRNKPYLGDLGPDIHTTAFRPPDTTRRPTSPGSSALSRSTGS